MEWVCGCPFMLGNPPLASMPSLMCHEVTIGMTSKLDENMGMTSEQLSKHENVMGTWKWTLEPFCNM